MAVRGLEWVVNYEKTRWFLVLQLERAPQDGLNKLLHISNQTVTSFGQVPLYTNSLDDSHDGQPRKRQVANAGRPKRTTRVPVTSSTNQSRGSSDIDMPSCFHVSIGWTLGVPTQDLNDRLNTTGIHSQTLKVDVNTVKIKIGNAITAVSLEPKIDSSNKILEK